MSIRENFNTVKRVRRSFAKIASPIDTPNLVDIQRKSFELFLQSNVAPDKREPSGLQGVFKSVFPITDFNNTCSLEFESYTIEKPKYDVDECRLRGMTFAAPIKITVRLLVWEIDEQTKTRNIRDVKEQEVYMGEVPLMTETGSFIINGTERVVVSQLHRSPGVFFDHDGGMTHSSGKYLFSARVIPYRGSWLDLEFDHKDFLYCRIDRRRKLPGTVLLKALGMNTEEILNTFYDVEEVSINESGFSRDVNPNLLLGQRAVDDVLDPKSGEVIVKKSRKFTRAVLAELEKRKIKTIPMSLEEVVGKVVTSDVLHSKTQEVLVEVNQTLTEAIIETLKDAGVKKIKTAFIDGVNVGSFLRDTLLIDKIGSQDEALVEIFKRMRPGDPPTLESSKTLFNDLFFNEARYDLSKVGRLKINHKFGFKDVSSETGVLTKQDIVATFKHLLELKNGRGVVDDIDHLGNRRVRSVGELLENQYRIGLVRMERAVKERMSLQEIETQMPHDLINAKPVSAIVKEFFGLSQLSQFMEQTNPLSEITHKRRLSALGPGGLTRERAGFEVRDVHPTHYGRICPIETPEGPNIGLISSLATFAKVNDYGFVETPYRKVDSSRVTDEVSYFSALEEEGHTIAQANVPLTEKGHFRDEFTEARRHGEPSLVRCEEVDLVDVSPNQLVSVAASLVPFLENDDANRALMGSNMQRQAVPLMISKAPLVGTGVERLVARDSGVTVVARNEGVVESVDASRIVVRTETKNKTTGSEVDIYNLVKYRRSNQNTCVNQTPIVKVGDKVRKGEVIADGPSTELGELALGQNVLVAFTPWGGYNFEDSILISERLLKDDVFTSIHIEEFECIARDTKLGKEEITRDIPNCGEEALRNLDATGIIRIGAEVTPGDILVGKITPKGETQLSPEEKLLRAIFGEKAGDVRDTSLRVPPGVYGTVINAHIFSREGIDKDERYQQIVRDEEERLLKDQAIEITIIRSATLKKVKKLIVGQTTTSKLLSEDGEQTLLKKDQVLTEEDVDSIPFNLLRHIPIEEKLEDQLIRIMDSVEEQMDLVRIVFNERIGKLKKGDELPPGVIKMVKVSVAIKRKLSVGDKMAGRHGNKGVISRILPQEDMPFLADGSPVDIVLNPLGVPSRMNVGQILETHLGWAARGIGERINEMLANYRADEMRKYLKSVHDSPTLHKYLDECSDSEVQRVARSYKEGVPMASSVFDRASEEDIRRMLSAAKLPTSGQAILFDGRTGEAFDHEVTVGIMYMLKLHHLVEDKIHARSIGPYSLVTQQPLGGKAQFGGQRLGEMEVWALEAYGAAYGLQEMLTVKSDDVAGRTRMYEAIVKGENVLEPGMPESFNVLMQELKALSLNVELLERNSPEASAN
jgi:DNA-directed RNA polymerase subunit beta